MGLRESPYSNRVLGGLDTTTRALLFPGYWLASEILALRRTTGEKPGCAPHGLEVAVRGPPLLLLLLLYSPILLLVFLLWLPLQSARRPFAYQHTPGRASPELWALPGRPRTLILLSGNVCLLPEGLAKFSNLWQTQWRAGHIGQSLAQAARCSTPCPTAGAPNGLAISHGLPVPPAGVLSHPPGDAVVTVELPLMEEVGALAVEPQEPREICVCFPSGVDIVCLQEVFDLRASAHLCRLLGPQYEHIIYDVGIYGLHAGSALKLLNSGLFLASRYPILAAEFHCYPKATSEDALAAKGLLCVQVSQPGPPWAMEGRERGPATTWPSCQGGAPGASAVGLKAAWQPLTILLPILSLEAEGGGGLLLQVPWTTDCYDAMRPSLTIRGALDDLEPVGPLKVFPLVAPSEVKGISVDSPT